MAHHNAILTEEDVRRIRAEYAAGGVTYQQLADKYNLSKSYVGDIIRRNVWRKLEG